MEIDDLIFSGVPMIANMSFSSLKSCFATRLRSLNVTSSINFDRSVRYSTPNLCRCSATRRPAILREFVNCNPYEPL